MFLKAFDLLSTIVGHLQKGTVETFDFDDARKVFEIEIRSGDPILSNSATHDGSSGKSSTAKKEGILVPTAMLDNFMGLSGEITVIRKMVNKLVSSIERSIPGNDDVVLLGELLDEMNKINGNMQNQITELRKVPVSKLYRPLPRTVRDLSNNLGKKISLELKGDDLRVDASIGQVLSNSLMHLLRKSLDHGLETPAQRKASGKPEEGQIKLSSFDDGENIVVEISDDGRGIDPENIRRKCIEKNMFTQEEVYNMSDKKILTQILEPGFSTAQKVTDISGRGVGMDMVKNSVESLKGTIDINSKPGEGTSFKITKPIPKSVLIINSLIVEACGHSFAVPQDNIVRLIRLSQNKANGDISMLQGTPVLKFDGRLVPLVDLGEVLNMDASDKKADELNEIPIVVLKTENGIFALKIDAILDAEDVVAKPLIKGIEMLEAYSGSTFMGDGSVGLILDCDGIATIAGILSHEETKSKSLSSSQTTVRDSSSNEYLIFTLNCDGQFAIPLRDTFRLEEFKQTTVQKSGEQDVIVYRDTIMPLLDLQHIVNIPQRQKSESYEKDPSVIVVKSNERLYGFIIKEIVDIKLSLEQLHTDIRDRDSFDGTMCIGDKTTTVVSVERLIKQYEKSLAPVAINA